MTTWKLKGSLDYAWINKQNTFNGTWNESFGAKIVKIPVGFGYLMSRDKKIRPYLNISYEFIKKISDNPKFFTNVDQPLKFETSNSWRGLGLAFGAESTLNKAIVFLQAKYVSTAVIDKTSSATPIASISGFQLIGGVKF